MSEKVILEMSVYTDGDWGFNESLFSAYKSKYFENEVYEYTFIEDYSLKIRRTFEDVKDGFNKIANLLTDFKDSIRCRDEYTKNQLNSFFCNQIEFARSNLEFQSEIDSNTEIDLHVYIIENGCRPIKEIIYT